MEKQQIEDTIAGGHTERFTFEAETNILIKNTNQMEIDNYERIFKGDQTDIRLMEHIEFRKFLPQYHGWVKNEDGTTSIKLENLLGDKPRASLIDFKMGTTSVTGNTPADKVEAINRKDAETTSTRLGFRVTGYIIKGPEGVILEKEYKPHKTVTEEHLPGIIRKLLKYHDKEEINREALQFYIKWLEDFHGFFANKNSRAIRGSSILMIHDSINNKFDMRLIDLATIDDLEDTTKRDEGFLKGIQSKLVILKQISEE